MTIRSKTMLASTAVVAGLVVAAVTTEADAATVTLNSVSGVWTSTSPAAGVRGVGSEEIRWGTPFGGTEQSGYRFDGEASTEDYNVGEEFTAGTFRHFNEPISSAGVELEEATLEVKFAGTIGNGTGKAFDLTSAFKFNHLETPNIASICADGGANGIGVNSNGCADRVTFAVNPGATDTVDIDGVLHVLTLTGFVIPGDATAFWTTEEATNTAQITGVLTAQSTIVPVPAALPLLLTALASLGAVGYRRRTID